MWGKYAHRWGVLGGICVAASDKELKSWLESEPAASWNNSQMCAPINPLHLTP